MDHKISKDMISSGMIPSGEKAQSDLGRTQYGSAPSPSSLMDAYKSIYEHHQKDADGKVIEHDDEELNERVKGGGVSTSLPKQKEKQKVIDKLTGYGQTQKGVGAASLIPNSAFKEETGDRRRITRPDSEVKTEVKPEVKPFPGTDKHFRYKIDNSNMINTGLDLFDLVKGRLIDEGCDEQEALKIMANISQEDFDKLKEDITLTKGDYASRNTKGSAYSTAKSKGFKGYKAGGGLGSNFLPQV